MLKKILKKEKNGTALPRIGVVLTSPRISSRDEGGDKATLNFYCQ